MLGTRKAVGLQGALDAKNSHDACLARNAEGGVGGSVPATLSLTLGAPASFGAFTPGRGEGLHGVHDGHRRLHGGQRDARRDRATRVKLINGSFALRRAAAVVGVSAGPSAGRRPGLQRRGHGRLQAADRRERRASHRAVREDADADALDDDSVEGRPRLAGGALPFRATAVGAQDCAGGHSFPRARLGESAVPLTVAPPPGTAMRHRANGTPTRRRSPSADRGGCATDAPAPEPALPTPAATARTVAAGVLLAAVRGRRRRRRWSALPPRPSGCSSPATPPDLRRPAPALVTAALAFALRRDARRSGLAWAAPRARDARARRCRHRRLAALGHPAPGGRRGDRRRRRSRWRATAAPGRPAPRPLAGSPRRARRSSPLAAGDRRARARAHAAVQPHARAAAPGAARPGCERARGADRASPSRPNARRGARHPRPTPRRDARRPHGAPRRPRRPTPSTRQPSRGRPRPRGRAGRDARRGTDGDRATPKAAPAQDPLARPRRGRRPPRRADGHAAPPAARPAPRRPSAADAKRLRARPTTRRSTSGASRTRGPCSRPRPRAVRRLRAAGRPATPRRSRASREPDVDRAGRIASRMHLARRPRRGCPRRSFRVRGASCACPASGASPACAEPRSTTRLRIEMSMSSTSSSYLAAADRRASCVAPGTRVRPWTVFPPALSGATQGARGASL